MIIGPAPLTQSRTCVSGYTCVLGTFTGSFLTHDDKVAIRDTCGLSTAVVGFPNEGLLTSGALPRISLSGGLYRLCWCSLPGGCERPEDFRTDFGSLHLLGPSPLDQHRTCVSGQTCRISDMSFYNQFEFDWSIGRLLILETCASRSVLPRIWAEPIRPPATSYFSSLLGAFQTEVISVAGGLYNLCWCSTIPGPCVDAEDFHVSVGMIDIIGPTPLRQDRTCTSGQSCYFGGLLGEYTHSSILIADTCGTDPAVFVPKYVNTGLADVVDNGMAMWRNAITAAGGQYRLCWCPSTAACARAADFTTDMGGLLLLGPTPLQQDRTCVSGLSCEFEGFLGRHISSQDRVLLSETCGETYLPPSQMPPAQVLASQTGTAAVSWGSSPMLAAGGFYRLCWCSGLLSRCEAHADFSTDVGMLTVIGVNPLQRTCISGLPCALEGVTGTHLSAGDHFAVLQTCGLNVASIDGFPGSGATAQVTSSGARVSWGPLPVTAAGGIYSLCWCAGVPGSTAAECGALGHECRVGTGIFRAKSRKVSP